MMALVIDTSVAAAWCFQDEEGSAEADGLMSRIADEGGVVPGLFWHELRNILIVAERRKRIDLRAAEVYLKRVRAFPLVTDDNQDDAKTLTLCRRHGLSGYDAAYLETAQRRGIPLATLDKKLAKAAKDEVGAAGKKARTKRKKTSRN